MNKTIIINISGIVFHIEEDAYEVLRNYMITVKKHFGLSPESHEIIIDIENRIAEMFGELLIEGKKEVITATDVYNVMKQMGSVEDFESADHAPFSAADGSQEEVFERPFKKLLRDMEDKVIGGVCSGLGHYLGVKALWIRLVFLLAALFAGTGFFLYLILWIVIPGARTRAERMSMRGEPINLHNFQKKFEEEMYDLKSTFRNSSREASPVLQTLGNAILRLGKIFVKIVAVMFILGLSIGLIVLIISILATFEFFGNEHDMSMFPVNIFDPGIQSQLLISLIVVAAIPLVALIGAIIRIIFNRTLINRYLGFSLLIIWLVGVGFSTIFLTRTLKDFQEESTLVEEKVLVPFASYTLKMNDIQIINISNDTTRSNTILQGIERRNEMSLYRKNRTFIRIVRVDSLTVPVLEIAFSAKGKTYEDATKRIERISYSMVQDGENLIFDSHPLMRDKDVFRNQKVKLQLKIPVGTKLTIEDNIRWNLSGLPLSQCYENFKTLHGREATETDWIMTNTGLKCIYELPRDSTASAESQM